MKRFVPVADEVWRLHHEKGRDCDLFRKIAEQGHYAGRVFPSDTRQGIYACAPSGVLLASINSNSVKRVSSMLDSAIAKWDAMSDEDKWLANLDADTPTGGSDFVSRQPMDSTVLKVFCRDLDRPQVGDDWRTTAYNVDFAWLRGDEALAFVPKAAMGAARDVDESLVKRFAALHFVDTVRGQSPAYEDNEIEVASLRSKVIALDGDRMRIEFSGRTKAHAKGKWSVSNFKDAGKPTDQERGVELALGGTATFDLASKRFVEFHLAGSGTRYGGTQFNERGRDLAPSAIGFAVVLASIHERVPPADFWRYPAP